MGLGGAEVDRKALLRSGRPATVLEIGTHLHHEVLLPHLPAPNFYGTLQPHRSLYQSLRLLCGFPATNLNADQEEEIGGTSIMSSFNSTSKVQDNEVELPGFRFHPTDEELVGFYLRRKVEKKPLSIELIKQIDIYKYDPWVLSKSGNVEDKEWYFFCKRGRKYRNIIKPNRVTGSGFWKATGIDRPVYSHGGEGRHCIGLKKTLVYYHGSTGEGGETDWMMHEFCLQNSVTDNNTNLAQVKSIANPAEAEIWTICRMFHRNVSYRNYSAEWRDMATESQVGTSSNSGSPVKSCHKFSPECCTSLGASVINYDNEAKPAVVTPYTLTSSITHKQPSTVSYSSFSCTDENDDHQFFSDESN